MWHCLHPEKNPFAFPDIHRVTMSEGKAQPESVAVVQHTCCAPALGPDPPAGSAGGRGASAYPSKRQR